MGRRRNSYQKKEVNPKRRRNDDVVAPEDMDDEIDAFHKQRDIVPLDMDEYVGESDEDNEHPVFDIEDTSDDEDDDNQEFEDKGLAAKIVRQSKFLREKIGGVEDEMHDDDEEEEDKKALWGRKKALYYETDEASSDEEALEAEEKEVLRLQREKAKYMTMEDFGLEDEGEDESDGEPTMEEILTKGKKKTKAPATDEAINDMVPVYEEVKKDINALSKEEQMDVVYSSAPELVGLLEELNDSVDQLENKVSPLLSKAKEMGYEVTGAIRFLEMKEILLALYCQYITYYLFRKAKGEPVRDHPVIGRLVEVKSFLDRAKKLEGNLPPNLENILNYNPEKNNKVASVPGSDKKDHKPSRVEEPIHTAELVKMDLGTENKKRKQTQDDEVSSLSREMLKVRAALEEKLQKRVFSSDSKKFDGAQKKLKPFNRQLETYDDFDDDVVNAEGNNQQLNNGHSSSFKSSKISQLVSAKSIKPKLVSGDDDLPKRDDIGERRRKHELRVLAGAGINYGYDNDDEVGNPTDNEDAEVEEDGEEESEDEFYKEVRLLREAKLAAKSEKYERKVTVPSLPETVDGRRKISYEIEKNRGLTRYRKKLTKNPRKKYKLKHQKAVVRRKGQVRDIRRPSGSYGGETSGINAGISRSVRFNN